MRRLQIRAGEQLAELISLRRADDLLKRDQVGVQPPQLPAVVGLQPGPRGPVRPHCGGAVLPGAALECWRGPRLVMPGRYRCTGPTPMISSSKATGGLVLSHLPCDLGATARMCDRYLPWPLIPAYLPVPDSSLLVPCWLAVNRHVRGLNDVGPVGFEKLNLIVPLGT